MNSYPLLTFYREIALEELGIRDMNLTEQTEEALEDEKAATNEARKLGALQRFPTFRIVVFGFF